MEHIYNMFCASFYLNLQESNTCLVIRKRDEQYINFTIKKVWFAERPEDTAVSIFHMLKGLLRVRDHWELGAIGGRI